MPMAALLRRLEPDLNMFKSPLVTGRCPHPAAVILNTFNSTRRDTRRSSVRRGDDKGVSGQRLTREDPAGRFLDLYDRALPQVYGYLLARCGQRAVAEDLTAETFLAAVGVVRGVRRGPAPAPLSTGWLIGVARHKLSDHWRRPAPEGPTPRAAAGPEPGPADPWDEPLDAVTAREVLGLLGSHHRAALTLRYVDDLPVPEVAAILGRTVHATEALLVRARSAFRAAYADRGGECG